MTLPTPITREIASKILKVVDNGLSNGLGTGNFGEMCVESAVARALGLSYGDNPPCVARSLRNLVIRLNDSNWSSNDARAKGLRRLSVAQLGSHIALDENEFVRQLARKSLPSGLPTAADLDMRQAYTYTYAYAAYAAAANTDGAKERDKSLAEYAESIVQVLVNMKAPGCQWLVLTEVAP